MINLKNALDELLNNANNSKKISIEEEYNKVLNGGHSEYPIDLDIINEYLNQYYIDLSIENLIVLYVDICDSLSKISEDQFIENNKIHILIFNKAVVLAILLNKEL